jgi:large subunit ribosomal protein L25
MKAIELRAQPRTLIGKKVKLLRHQDIVPGVVYGRHIDPVAVQFDVKDLMSALHRAGTSAAVQLELEGVDEPYLAIFRDVQHHPIRRDVSHVDLQALSLDETVRVPVNVVVVGVAPATTEGEGVLMQLLTELEIEALPTALIASIEIDVSGMAEVGDTITVGDVIVPEGVTIVTPATETVVQITYMAEEELEEEEVVPLEGELGILGVEGELEGEEAEFGEQEEEE